MKIPTVVGLIVLAAVTSLTAERQQSHFATFGTNKVHYLTAGQGTKTLVFVHGWACDADFWREQVPALSERAKLVLIDLPGHGRSDKPRVPYTMTFLGEAVQAVMKDAKISKAALIGHSMGAAVIARAYALSPESVSAIVPIDGMLRRPEIKAENIEKFIGAYRTEGYREHATKFVTGMFPNAGTETLRDRVIKDMLATPQYVMSGAMEGMFAPDQPNWDPKKVSVPVLVINAKSPMWTADYEGYIKGLSPETEYRTIDGAGHFLMLEKPKEFNAVLIEVLGKHELIGK
jgi:pimeloyl-ACP methyl ester carboxylesterase